MTKICPNCNTKNENEAIYCKECGKGLPKTIVKKREVSKSNNTSQGFNTWWNRQDSLVKGLAVVGTFCIGVLLIIGIFALVLPEGDSNLIYLDLEGVESDGAGQVHAYIDTSTTEYVVNGTTEANTTVSISSDSLNVSNQPLPLDSNDKFTYKVNVPLNVSEIKIRFDAKKTGKDDTYVELTIKRPEKTKGQYSVNGSYFDMPAGWEKIENEITKKLSVSSFKKGNDPRLEIEQLTPEEYDSNYLEESKSNTGYKIEKDTINISGVEVKVLRVTDTQNGDILDSYFFQKNGKYYEIRTWDFTTQAAARPTINEAVNIIVSTLS